MSQSKLGISGRIAAYFQNAQITPLLALLCLLLGLFAVVVTPREEEPQINVTMANVMIPFPGGSTKDVEQMVAIPAEQVFSQMLGVEHVMSASTPGMAIITVQFKVGVPRTEALVRLHDTAADNADWLPRNLGVQNPIIKPKGIDDVPIVNLTLHSDNANVTSMQLLQVAQRIEADLKRVNGTREVVTVGGNRHAVRVELNLDALKKRGFTINDIHNILVAANVGMPSGDLLTNAGAIYVETGRFLQNAAEVGDLVLGVRASSPVYLKDVAQVVDGPAQEQREVFYEEGKTGQPQPAVTIAITKKAGENAIDVANAVIHRIDELKGTQIPDDITVTVTRNYGETANDKASKLIHKLIFVTLSVIALVWVALGRREAFIVGVAVILTLMATLFASWAWGFTINRVSLFALIFSIGILVDDAIVVVENIDRHHKMAPHTPLLQIIPGAVDEVGNPTILATLTVIAALLPMAFVSGLMGPYMSPIPINASMGMLLSLLIAFIITPWMANRFLGHGPVAAAHGDGNSKIRRLIGNIFTRIFTPLLDEHRGRWNRFKLMIGIVVAIGISLWLPVHGLVVLKMLPFDNKSEFQVVLDMPESSKLEETTAVLKEMSEFLVRQPQVKDVQIYSGTAVPINFNGLVRQYYLRQAPYLGDIQVNLVGKDERHEKSHQIAASLRPELATIAAKYNAVVKVVEVPPGPPVLAPIVAEIYGPEQTGRFQIAKEFRKIFQDVPHVVDIDDSSLKTNQKRMLVVDRERASLMGVPQSAIVATLQTGLSGADVTYLHDGSKYPKPVIVRLPKSSQDSLDKLLQLTVRNAMREDVPLSKLVRVMDEQNSQPIYHKDLLPVHYVTGDVSGGEDSPLYGLFKSRGKIDDLKGADQKPLNEYFISQPSNPYQQYSFKWDGEWQVTYETFRDMGAAYAVGIILIYLLVVAQFGSYLTPLIIMAPIPLTIIGVMPGHALFGAQFTATSMIGMIALAGIIVRNSILLVDFIMLEVTAGKPFKEAIIGSAVTRAQPILLTAFAAILGAFFILDDPIFNGLAISLIFGILVSTLLTLVVIPLLYYMAYRKKYQ